MTRLIEIDYDNFIDLYLNKNLSRDEVADRLNISLTTVKRFITKHDIHKSHEQIQRQRENTNISQLGTKCPFTNDQIKQAIKETNIKKYGIENPAKSIAIKNKISQTIQNKDDDFFIQREAKRKQTCLEKYGVTHNMKSPNLKNKGYINLAINAGFTEDLVKKGKQLKLEKEINTKRKNKSFNTSKPEDMVYQILMSRFKDIYRQYSSAEYPFACDFYVKDLDLYVECNFHWTHGIYTRRICAPYDKNNPEHKKLLELWKSKNTKYFNEAIKTWTVRDPLKLKTATKNHLNYLVFYTLDEFKSWFNSL